MGQVTFNSQGEFDGKFYEFYLDGSLKSIKFYSKGQQLNTEYYADGISYSLE
ncbi:hypothetical protein [Shewanella sp. NIFS-20-20]|uniref:hypothetical protein n=1 Tax=Shewanella sp. NIFS-20-20 TaxID=2853806 RepID=UPI001C497767|nr:hypothetical protein [Shewanella sp. NIFS-20-20]MBV7314479.1 hypothetical protein [Shewanella sp. NIFS-20-20]